MCGPTGSGKTTTLHSALKYINKPETKIWTAEDPVEITQRGLRQVQIKPKIGFDFPAALRAFLRSDPDVIMIGEMREYGIEEFNANVSVAYRDDLNLSKAVGCKACNGSGYRSRMALHELLMGTEELKRLIQSKGRVDDLRAQAIKDGMTTLKQDGIEKIFSGQLDLLQVRKVCIK